MTTINQKMVSELARLRAALEKVETVEAKQVLAQTPISAAAKHLYFCQWQGKSLKEHRKADKAFRAAWLGFV